MFIVYTCFGEHVICACLCYSEQPVLGVSGVFPCRCILSIQGSVVDAFDACFVPKDALSLCVFSKTEDKREESCLIAAEEWLPSDISACWVWLQPAKKVGKKAKITKERLSERKTRQMGVKFNKKRHSGTERVSVHEKIKVWESSTQGDRRGKGKGRLQKTKRLIKSGHLLCYCHHNPIIRFL